MRLPVKIAFAVLVFLALPVLYTLEILYLNRTLHAGQLMIIAAFIGFVIGILFGYRYQKKATEPVGRIRAYAVCMLLSVVTLPLLASLSNRLWSVHPTRKVPVEFVEESARYAGRFGAGETATANTYFTFFYKNQKLFKIQTRQPVFPGAKRGDIVELPLKRGLWGFDVVQRLR